MTSNRSIVSMNAFAGASKSSGNDAGAVVGLSGLVLTFARQDPRAANTS